MRKQVVQSAADRGHKSGTHLEASADQSSSNEEDGEAGDHWGETPSEHAGWHEG